MSDEIVGAGISAGSLFAAIISYSLWKSFWWMLLHAAFGWVYIIYWAIKY